ncbi:MAG: hypothetical protein A3F09_05070 [Chlamydiae bacterium RIFCSPHIGHO2_12_FULL_49_11]|nr:MAG: hypothetical protein A3F09_05070 [Chlamydiae bacterium RIFCSPHIGHO2_12_FULL_49_11]
MKFSRFGFAVFCTLSVFIAFGIYISARYVGRQNALAELEEPSFLEVVTLDKPKEFAFIIPVTANPRENTKLVETIFDQEYDMYKIIFLYTRKEEKAAQDLKHYIVKENKGGRVTWVESKGETITLLDYCHAVFSCQNEEIIFSIDPASWLAHKQVLKKLSDIYSISQEVWVTYSDFLIFPSLEKIDIAKLQKMISPDRKDFLWTSSHVKTFYAGLLKESLSDVKLNLDRPLTDTSIRELLMVTKDRAKRHIRYINEVFYLYSAQS